MTNIDRIQLSVTTGNESIDQDHRVFLGFTGAHGREFRCREENDDNNPFRAGQRVLIFGNGSNVGNPSLNDPRNPVLDDLHIGRAYIRIDPESEDEWLIQDAEVSINGNLTHRLRIQNIILHEDASEIVYLD